MHLIDCMFLHVAKLYTISAERRLTNATGFFFQKEGFLYLITARHVVQNPSIGHQPESLQVTLHVNDKDFKQVNELAIPLYVNGIPQWYEHPSRDEIDLVAVAINDPSVLCNHVVYPFKQEDILTSDQSLPLGQDAIILGFPLGFQDQRNHLPIVRRATIASSYAYPFNGERYFLTDSRLHRGMSGSPVIAKIPDFQHANGRVESRWRLLGIHTSALEVSDRDPMQDDRLALNKTWYSELLTEMLPIRSTSDSLNYEHRFLA